MPDATPSTIGVDFGTLSGRAVVVRVSDGAELGARRARVPARRPRPRRCPGPAPPLPPDWALQVPADYVEVLRTAVPAAVAAAGVDPADVIGIGTDFTACTMVPDDSPTAPRCASCRELARPTRTPTSSCGSTTPPSRRPTGSTSWPRERGEAVAAAVRRADLLGVGVRQGPAAARGGPGGLRRDGALGRGRRLDRLAAVAARYVRNACTAGYKGIHQDGAYPSRDFLAALNPGFASFVERQARRTRSASSAPRAGRLTAAGRRAGPACPRASRSPSATSTPTSPRRPRGAIEPGQMVAIMGTSTCHVMNGDALREVPGHVRRRRRRHRRRACGATRPGRAASATSSAGSSTHQVPPAYARGAPSAAGLACTSTSPRWPPTQAVGEHGLVALDWHSGNRSVLVDHELSGLVVGLTLATRARGRLPRAARGHGVRHPGDRRGVRGRRRPGRPSSSSPAACCKNPLLMQIYADVLRPAALDRSAPTQGPALGSAIHAAVAAGAYPDVPRPPRRWAGVDRGVYLPDAGQRRRPTTSCTPSTARLHDHFGRGGNDVMHRLKRDPPRGPGMTVDDRTTGRAMHDAVARPARTRSPRCTRELTRYDLVVWTAGNVSRPGARRAT